MDDKRMAEILRDLGWWASVSRERLQADVPHVLMAMDLLDEVRTLTNQNRALREELDRALLEKVAY